MATYSLKAFVFNDEPLSITYQTDTQVNLPSNTSGTVSDPTVTFDLTPGENQGTEFTLTSESPLSPYPSKAESWQMVYENFPSGSTGSSLKKFDKKKKNKQGSGVPVKATSISLVLVDGTNYTFSIQMESENGTTNKIISQALSGNTITITIDTSQSGNLGASQALVISSNSFNLKVVVKDQSGNSNQLAEFEIQPF